MDTDLAARFVVISGCSSGGKSTLIDELAKRGHAVVEEPGRHIIADEIARGGAALPWIDLAAFAQRAIEVALQDREHAARHPGFVFFDRSLVDAVVALDHVSGEQHAEPLCRAHRYHYRVFLTPPWPEIFDNDADRRHDIGAAIEEYDRLRDAYPRLGYEVVLLPKIPASARADCILDFLGAHAS